MANSLSNVRPNVLANVRSNIGSGGAAPEIPLPALANIIYQHNLWDGNLSPQVGTYAYARSGSLYASDSASTLKAYTANQVPLGVRFGGTESMIGAWLGGAIINNLAYSEDFTQAEWVQIGTGTVSGNTAVAPDVTITADTVSGTTLGDGVEQQTAVAAADSLFVFSIWLKTSTGTATARIVVLDEGDQAGFVDCPVTTSWKRFQVPHKFYTGTGNVAVQLLVNAQTTVRAWGAQLENFTTGSADRFRNAVANEYTKTTTVAATAGSSTYLVPNATVDQASVAGSISFWVLSQWDWCDASSQTGQFFFSSNFDLLSMTMVREQFIVYINNAVAVQTPTGLTNSAMRGVQPDRWTHFCFTWNTTTDVYKLYIDGTIAATSTAPQSAINFGGNDLNFGNYVNGVSPYPKYSADVYMSQIVIWNSALDATEVMQAYESKASIATRADPGTGKIFSLELSTSPIPTVGDSEHYFSNLGLQGYYMADSTTTLSPVNALEYPINYPLNGFNKAGWGFTSNMTNLILQSEDITTTWTAVGAPTLAALGGTFLGTLNYGTILGTAGMGVTQSLGTAAASTSWTGSVYASVAAGTLDCQLILQGDSGGTPQTVTQNITLTTTPQRFNVHGVFTGAATGNISMQFLLNAAGTARVGGFMLERANNGAGTTFQKVGSPYIKTTVASAGYRHNQICYRASDSFNPKKGTLLAWAFLNPALAADFVVANGPAIIAAPGQFANFYYHFGNADDHDFAYGGLSPATSGPEPMTSGVWYQLACTWDAVAGLFAVYMNGVLLDSSVTVPTYILNFRKFFIGGDYVFAPMDYWQGSIDKVDIYGEAKDVAFILADFNATKATYGY